MALLGPALLSLGKLIAVLDPDGALRWAWFAKPHVETLQGLPKNREHLGALVRALLDRDYPGVDRPYDAELDWEPINLGEQVETGFAWTSSGDLRIGFAAKANFALGDQAIDLSVLARLVSITPAGALAGEFGRLRFSGVAPTPEFLQSATIDGEIAQAVTLDLTVVDADGRLRELTLAGNDFLAWDAARLATFVLQAWVRHEAAGGAPDGFFARVDGHLFPMLGDPPTSAIQPFPLVGDTMGTSFDVGPWKDSVFTTGNDAAGALTFLWHLRALLTGNEAPEFFGGSYWFPLVSGTPQGAPPTQPQPAGPFNPGPNSAWVGITTANNLFALVLDLRDGGGVSHAITLATVQGGTLTQPELNTQAFADLAAYLGSGAFPMTLGDGEIVATPAANGWRLTVARGSIAATGLEGFDGTYALQLDLQAAQPVAYRLVTPTFELALPPGEQPLDGRILFATILQWVLGALPAAKAGALGALPATLGLVIRDALDPAASPDLTALMGALAGGAPIDIGPAEVTVAGTGTATHIEPALSVGPLAPGDLGDLPVHIGRLQVQGRLAVNPSGAAVEGFSVALIDVRLDAAAGGQADGLLASLLPDLREVPGFSLKFISPDSLIVSGSARIPIQETIGPLELIALTVEPRGQSLSVGIDLAFQLAMIRVTAYELGVTFPFSDEPPVPFLHGLGVSCDTDLFRLAGMFAEVQTAQGSDYVGGAVVSIAGLFELTAIGGYTEQDGEASLFVFASLVAPLGGPPWFFITGIAGGFGYNRTLPPAGLLAKHPFIRVMRGELVITGPAPVALVSLSADFSVLHGQHWVAAGIQFTCFGFIEGEVVVVVSFGQAFSIAILGIAAFGIKPIAYFELGIEATADEEKFLVKAGLSSDSYVIHPEIFGLRGEFALGVWHSGDHSGDFVLSIGGYHPYFKVPGHYPTLQRVGGKCTVYGFITMTVDCFFACTPQAIMAGASVSLSATFAGVAAGLDVYVDVFIRWDPFLLRARMGITVWFEVLGGRHEASVELEIHTPPLGGLAVIDLTLASFDVAFGAPLNKLPNPPLEEFVSRQLNVPASRVDGTVQVPTFSTDDGAGLMRVDILEGRSSEREQSDSGKQEGLDEPVRVAAEFAFSVRTRLPLNIHGVSAANPPSATLTSTDVNLPLCSGPSTDLTGTLTVTAPNAGSSERTWLADFFPAAHFGAALPTAQAHETGARQAVAAIDPGQAVISLVDGVRFGYKAGPIPRSTPALTATAFEQPLADEAYPLPLGWPQAPVAPRMPKATLTFSEAPLAMTFASKAPAARRQARALADLGARTAPPLDVSTRTADLQRHVLPFSTRGLTVAAPPAGAAVITPPVSPPRRPELFGINLRVLPIAAPVAVTARRLETLRRAPRLERRTLTRADRPVRDLSADLQVDAGRALAIDLAGGQQNRTRLALSGTQIVRAIHLGGGGDVLEQTYVSGSRILSPPRRTRRIVLVGEGSRAAVVPVAQDAAAVAAEAIGIEHHTVALALDRRTFAAHGCVLAANMALPLNADPLDGVPGRELLDHLTNARVHFPAIPPRWSLLIAVRPNADDPGRGADGVRWASLDATLGTLATVIGAGRTAFVMPVTAPGSWTLDLDLGHHWRLDALVVCPRDDRDLTEWLQSRSEWDMVDDSIVRPRAAVTRVALEVNR